MSTPEQGIPQNPVDLAIPIATRLVFNPSIDTFDYGRDETDAIADLNLSLTGLNMCRKYQLTAQRSFIIPDEISLVKNGKASVTKIDHEIVLAANLICGALIKMNLGSQEQNIRSVCFMFKEASIARHRPNTDTPLEELPQEKVDPTESLYVPVFAIDNMRPLH